MKSEQKQLLDKAKRSLIGADLLIENNLPELAVSRAYYAMFYVASAFLLSKQLSFSSHAAVIGAFGREFAREDIDCREFHRSLIDAQDLRNRSDYDLDSEISVEDTEEQIEIARKFIQFFENTVK